MRARTREREKLLFSSLIENIEKNIENHGACNKHYLDKQFVMENL